MSLKNYTSEGRNTFEKIQNILSANGATKIMFDYDPDRSGRLVSLTFGLVIDGKSMAFRLPAMVENVTQILYGGKDRWDRPKEITEAQKLQAYRTAWANIRDWIDAQMALVATKQAKLQTVFLPYLVMKDQRTLAEHVASDPGFLLGDGK